MPKISEISLTESLMVQFIGKPGAGKSIAAASFPEPIYFFDLDGRMKPVAKFFPKRDIDYDTYYIDDFEKFARKLESFQLGHRYKTIVIDGLTSLADMFLQYGINLRGQGGKGDKKKGLVDLNSIEDYNVETRGLLQIINVLRELKSAHRILNTHILESEAYNLVENKNIVTRKTMTGGNKISAKIPGFFDEVWNFYVKPAALSTDPPRFCMSPVDRGFGLGKTVFPIPMEVDFTKCNTNPDGSLYKVIEQYLK